MGASEIIGIIDIAVSAVIAIIGFVIATKISNNFTQERFIKEYFTKELSELRNECKDFLDEILYDKKNAKDIKIGLKVITIKVQTIEKFIEKTFPKVSTNTQSIINMLQLCITSSTDYNSQYKNKFVVFSSGLKQQILAIRHTLLTDITGSVLEINKGDVKKAERKSFTTAKRFYKKTKQIARYCFQALIQIKPFR